jgi:RNA polymerase sigma-B factor
VSPFSSAQTLWTTGSEKPLVSVAGSPTTHEPLAVRPGDRAVTRMADARLREYAATRDPALREEIVLAYLGLADRLAMRFRHSRGTTPEDLTQTARTGLIAAVDRYDPARSSSFVPFAVASVVGELKRYLRDTSWRLHVPRQRKEQVLRLCRVTDELHQTLGRSPTTGELADQLRLTKDEVLETLEAAGTRIGFSLDRRAGDDDGDLPIGDLLAAPEPSEEPEDLLALADLIAGLPELERQVIVLRFFHDLDQSAIAARIGYSQMHVSRLLRRALARMRVQLVEP